MFYINMVKMCNVDENMYLHAKGFVGSFYLMCHFAFCLFD